MDPVPFTPPEVILNYEEPVHTQSGSLPFCHFPPRCHPAELNASSCEARTDASASQKPTTVAEMLRSTAVSTTQTQTASNQTPMGPVQHQGSPPFLHFLSGLSPPPLGLQDFPPDPPQMGLSPVFQELVFAPCSPQDPVWLNVSPLSVTPDSRFGGVSPCVLLPVSTPTETWFGPDSPAHFRLPQPHFCPSWCMCPESLAVHQPCTQNLLSSRAESAASGREQSGEPCKSGGQRSKICREEEKKRREERPVREKPPAGDGVSDSTKPGTSLTFLDPLDEESLANYAFEDYMSIMDALSPEIQEDTDAKAGETEEEKDGEEEEELDVESSSFLEYLDELCKDEDFVKKVGSMLDAEYLDSLLSSSLDPIDLLALEEQEQVASTLSTEEQINSFLSPDPEPINFIPLEEPEPETLDRLLQPALVPSHLLEETPGSQENDGFPLPEEPLHHNGSLFMNYTPSSPAETSPDTGRVSGLTAGDGNASVEAPAATLPAADGSQDESEDALVSLENLSDDRSAQWFQELQDGSLLGGRLASKSPSSCRVSDSLEDLHQDPAPGLGASSLTDSPLQSTGPPALRFLALKTLNLLPPPPPQIKEAEEHHRSPNQESFTNPPEDSDDPNHASPAPARLSFVEDSGGPQTDDDTTGSVPENQTVEPPKGPRVPQESATLGDFSDVGTGERQETETKCERDLEKGVGKPNEEKGTIEKKEENKETKLIRRSRRQSDQRVFGERKTETEEERIKKTAGSTPERDEAIHGKERPYSGEKQLCKTEESRGANVMNPEQPGETADEKQGQKLAEDQREADGSDVCAETGARDDLLIKTRQDRTSKEEAVRTSSITRRRTRSKTAEGKVRLSPGLSLSTRTRQKLKHSETQRNETESPPKRGAQVEQEVNLQENVTGAQTLPVLSREEEEKSETVKETHSSGCKVEEEASSSLPSPRAPTDTQSAQDDRGRLEESPLSERDEPLAAKTCEQQMKTASDGDGNNDFYSLRSTTRNTRQVRKSEKPDTLDGRGTRDDKVTRAARRPSELRDESLDEAAGAKGEREKMNGEERRGVASSPVKRHRRQGGDKAELEAETHKSSPTKRARRRKTEAKTSEKENEDETDTSAGGEIKEESAKKDGGGRPSRDERSVAETRKDRLSCKRGTRLSVKLPTKYEDFILCRPKRKRQTPAGRAGKKDGKRKKR